MHALSVPALPRPPRPALELIRPGRAAALVTAFAAVCASALLVDGRLTDLMLSEAASRAVDHVQLAVLDRVTAEDLSEPHTPAKLDDLAGRMGPAVDRMRQANSGLLRVNVIARDGAVLYSDENANRGHVVPLTKPEFVRALAGEVGRDESNLSTPENSDLGARYHDALEVYVPVRIDGRVVGVYEIYQDAGPMRTLRLVVWLAAAASLGLLLVACRRRLVAQPGGPRVPANGVSLTPRELDVLRLMTTSHSYREMAESLVISEETVRTHVKSILRKLGQPDSTRAVVAAVKAGIVELT